MLCYMRHVTCVMLHVSFCMCHVACVMLHVSCCMCHVACVMLHVSCCMCHVFVRFAAWTSMRTACMVWLGAQQMRGSTAHSRTMAGKGR